MSGLVASVRAAVAPEAVDSRIDRDGCRSDLLRRVIRLRNEIRQPLLFQCGDSLEPLFSDQNPAA